MQMSYPVRVCVRFGTSTEYPEMIGVDLEADLRCRPDHTRRLIKYTPIRQDLKLIQFVALARDLKFTLPFDIKRVA